MTRTSSSTGILEAPPSSGGSAQSLQAQNIITFDVPNSSSTRPRDINAAGAITGDASNRGFIRQPDGTFIQFDVSGSPTYPVAINPTNQVTGYYSDATGSHGFLRNRNGNIQTFDVPNALFPSTNPTALSPKGQIAGFYRATKLGVSSFLREPDGSFVLFYLNLSTAQSSKAASPQSSNTGASPQASRAETLPQFFSGEGDLPTAINGKGQIIGVYGNLRYHSYLRQPDGTIETFGVSTDVMPNTQAQAINAVGQITGFYFDGTGIHGFLREADGTLTQFDVPGSSNVFPAAINRSGWIVGHYTDANGVIRGFLRKPKGKFETFDAPGAVQGTFPLSINDKGNIVGYYQDANGLMHGFLSQ